MSSTTSDVYTSPYANNIGNMTNKEIVSLASNRFTDAETQVAIAKHDYRLGREYLAYNPKLAPQAAEVLWDIPGAVFKAVILRDGRIKFNKEDLEAVYRRYFSPGKRSACRVGMAFLGTRSWWYDRTEDVQCSRITHTALLEEIYTDYIAQAKFRESAHKLKLFLSCKNCSIAIAEKIAALPVPERRDYYSEGWDEMQGKALLLAEKLKARAETARVKSLEPRGGELPEEDE